jgi:hypothetical protein
MSESEDDKEWLEKMAAMLETMDAESAEILQSIYDRCKALGLSCAFFSKAMVDIISMNTRVTESGNNFRLTGPDNDILDPPESVGDILACCLALDAKTQLMNLLGIYAKPPVTNPPGFIKNENGTDKYAATKAEIENVSTPGDPGISIFLPRQFVKSDIVNYKIIEKCGNDLIIYIIRGNDVIGFANVCFTFFSDDYFQPEKGIFWNFFGVKNPTLGEPQVGGRVTGRQILELLEDLFRLLRFTRECVPREVPIPGYENVFDSGEIDKLAGCAAGPGALIFWKNNNYIQIRKEDAKAAGWTDEEIDDPNIFPVEKRLDKIEEAKAAVIVAVEEESVFSAAETQSMINARSQSKGTPIQPETSSQFPSRFKRPGSSQRSSAASSLASTAPPTQFSMFQIQPRVNNTIGRAGRLAVGAANATHYNPFGAGGGMPIGINRQQQMGSEIVNREIQDEVDNINRFGASKEDEDAFGNQVSINPILQAKTEAKTDDMLEEEEEESGVPTYNKWDLTLSNLQQGMKKSSSNLMPEFTGIRIPSAGMEEDSNIIGTSIPSAGKVKASNSNSNSNSISAGIERQNPNTFSLSNLNSINFGKDKKWEERQKTYQDMIREQKEAAVESNKRAYDDFVKKSEAAAAIPASIQPDSDVGRKRGPNWLSDADWSEDETPKPKPITKRNRRGGRKTKVKTKRNKKSVTKKRNPRQTKRRRQRRNTRQTKRRHK